MYDKALPFPTFNRESASPPGVGPAAASLPAVETEAAVSHGAAASFLASSSAVEQGAVNALVAGSNPALPANSESAATVCVTEKAPANVHADHMGTAGAEYRVPAGFVLVERELLGRVVKRLKQAAERERKEMFEPPLFLRKR